MHKKKRLKNSVACYQDFAVRRDSTAERSEGEAGIPLKIKYLFIPATLILSE